MMERRPNASPAIRRKNFSMLPQRCLRNPARKTAVHRDKNQSAPECAPTKYGRLHEALNDGPAERPALSDTARFHSARSSQNTGGLQNGALRRMSKRAAKAILLLAGCRTGELRVPCSPFICMALRIGGGGADVHCRDCFGEAIPAANARMAHWRQDCCTTPAT